MVLGGNGSAMIVGTGLSTTLNNVVFRNNFGTGGAVLVRTGGSLTATGCRDPFRQRALMIFMSQVAGPGRITALDPAAAPLATGIKPPSPRQR